MVECMRIELMIGLILEISVIPLYEHSMKEMVEMKGIAPSIADLQNQNFT